MTTYYSHGKLLLTGEYVVLDGALALAVPTKFGQSLEVEPISANNIEWIGYEENGNIWVQEIFTLTQIQGTSQPVTDVRSRLLQLLQFCYKESPWEGGFKMHTKLTFPRNWGLGTSSTLVNNLAQWRKIDAWDLLQATFGGSGYDIACAKNEVPIIYQLLDGDPLVKRVNFLPKFSKYLYFVHLNQKQDSQREVQKYLRKNHDWAKTIQPINRITKAVLACSDVQEFLQLIREHEVKMSDVLQSPTIQETFFSDFEGGIKSLGAWGGDFVLVVSQNNPSSYFASKGYTTILRYDEMVLPSVG